jgi:hypothetical protein
MHSHSFLRSALLGAALLLSVQAAEARDHDGKDHDDEVVLSFATVGDSRQDAVSPDPTQLPLSGQDARWLQNTKAWSRIISEVRERRPELLFFNGDMIMGYGNASVPVKTATVADIVGSDLVQFHTQYAFWRGMVAPLMESGTYVVPVPGNHETQCKACGKKALAVNEDAWRANMGDLILDENRFLALFGDKPANSAIGDTGMADGLASDQSKLTYSFDFRGVHFAVINTDPVGRDSHAPVGWLAADLAAAKARGVKASFVFGHKPAYTYYYGSGIPASPAGLDADVVARDAMWNVIEQFGATYFCGHEHIFNAMQPRGAQGGQSWQILVGSGGSPFEAKPSDVTVNPATDRSYAYAHVSVLRNGSVQIRAYGFDEHYGKTRMVRLLTLTPR